MHPSLVIFDVDGLMLDTEARWQQAWQEVGEKHGIDCLGQTTFLKCVGRNGKEVEDIVAKDLRQFGNPHDILLEARTYGLQLLSEHIDLKPGVVELLQHLTELNIPRAVATATDRELTIERLSRLNILQYFDYLLCGDEVVLRKPNPEIYLNVIEHFNVEAKDALVFEDSAVGVEAAYRANIPCIMVPDLIQPSSKQVQETKMIVSSLHDVIEFIESW